MAASVPDQYLIAASALPISFSDTKVSENLLKQAHQAIKIISSIQSPDGRAHGQRRILVGRVEHARRFALLHGPCRIQQGQIVVVRGMGQTGLRTPVQEGAQIGQIAAVHRGDIGRIER